MELTTLRNWQSRHIQNQMMTALPRNVETYQKCHDLFSPLNQSSRFLVKPRPIRIGHVRPTSNAQSCVMYPHVCTSQAPMGALRTQILDIPVSGNTISDTESVIRRKILGDPLLISDQVAAATSHLTDPIIPLYNTNSVHVLNRRCMESDCHDSLGHNNMMAQNQRIPFVSDDIPCTSLPQLRQHYTDDVMTNSAPCRIGNLVQQFHERTFRTEVEHRPLVPCSTTPWTSSYRMAMRRPGMNRKLHSFAQRIKRKSIHQQLKRKHFLLPSTHPTKHQVIERNPQDVSDLDQKIKTGDATKSEETDVECASTIDVDSTEESLECDQEKDYTENMGQSSLDGQMTERREKLPNLLNMSPIQLQAQTRFNVDVRKSFKCPQCRYVTDRKNNLKRHIVTMHQESSKLLECCGVSFQSKAALRDHNAIFHRGGYRCQICSRNFCRKALLRRHLTVHSGQKDFFCDLCGYATSHKSNLERHQKVHTKQVNFHPKRGRSAMMMRACYRQSALKERGLLRSEQFKRESNLGDASLCKRENEATDPSCCEPTLCSVEEEDTPGEIDIDNYYYIPEEESSRSTARRRVPFRKGMFPKRLFETYSQKAQHHLDIENPSSPETEDENDSKRNTFSENYDETTRNSGDESLTDEVQRNVESLEDTCGGKGGRNFVNSCLEVEAHALDEGTYSNSLDTGDRDSETGRRVHCKDQSYANHAPCAIHGCSCDSTGEVQAQGCFISPELHQVQIDLCPERRLTGRQRHRMCPLIYKCPDCNDSFLSQSELVSHTCQVICGNSAFTVPLMTAVKRGCLQFLSQL